MGGFIERDLRSPSSLKKPLVGPSYTTTPKCMTITLLRCSATMDMSWVITITVEPSLLSWLSRDIMSSVILKSWPVVGSSTMGTLGLIAIMDATVSLLLSPLLRNTGSSSTLCEGPTLSKASLTRASTSPEGSLRLRSPYATSS